MSSSKDTIPVPVAGAGTSQNSPPEEIHLQPLPPGGIPMMILSPEILWLMVENGALKDELEKANEANRALKEQNKRLNETVTSQQLQIDTKLSELMENSPSPQIGVVEPEGFGFGELTDGDGGSGSEEAGATVSDTEPMEEDDDLVQLGATLDGAGDKSEDSDEFQMDDNDSDQFQPTDCKVNVGTVSASSSISGIPLGGNSAAGCLVPDTLPKIAPKLDCPHQLSLGTRRAQNLGPRAHSQCQENRGSSGSSGVPDQLLLDRFKVKQSFVRVERLQLPAVVTRKGRYECNVCHKFFASKSGLNEHNNNHTGEKPYKCQICGKDYSYKSTLWQHKFTHMPKDKWPYRCESCGTCFSHKSHLKRHQMIHTRENPFTCTVCSKKYARRVNLEYHLKSHNM